MRAMMLSLLFLFIVCCIQPVSVLECAEQKQAVVNAPVAKPVQVKGLSSAPQAAPPAPRRNGFRGEIIIVPPPGPVAVGEFASMAVQGIGGSDLALCQVVPRWLGTQATVIEVRTWDDVPFLWFVAKVEGKYGIVVLAPNDPGKKIRRGEVTIQVGPGPVPPPDVLIADFIYRPETGAAPLTIHFTDTSTGAVRWSWAFGDGGSTEEQNPVHTFAKAGEYSVSLVVKSAAGKDAIRWAKIKVTDNPQPVPSPLHVLIVYEGDELDNLPRDQAAILTSREIRDYLVEKCEKVAGLAEYRFLDKDADVKLLSQDWQDVFARAKGKKMPWIIVANKSGGVFEGELPKDIKAALELLRKYGG